MLRALALLAALAAPPAQGAPSLGEETLPPGVSMALAQLAPQRPGVIDLYALVVAGDGTEDVFKREAEAVREVLDERLGARGRSLALVNHRSAARPQATLKSIELALNAMAKVMAEGASPDFSATYLATASSGSLRPSRTSTPCVARSE